MKTVQHGKIKPVTKDMTIGEAVQKYPEIIEILMSFGVHCVGCGISYFEPLEIGLRGHAGLTEEEMYEAIEIMNKRIAENETKEEDIKITPNALEKIAEVTAGKKGLRIIVKSGGCSEVQYIFEISEKKKDDIEISSADAPVFVEKSSFDKLKGSKIDYIDTLQGAGFKVTNPNAKETCSCNE